MAQNYVLLERIELNATTASVTFNNIPQTGYTDLKVVMSARSDQAGSVGQDVYVRFNGDSGANYSFRRLYGTGSSAASDAVSSSSTAGRIGRCTSNDATANTFASTEFYIPNYTSSTAKSISGDAVDETNATGAIAQLTATIWTGTAAITSMQLFPFSGGTNFVAGSTFSLYGLAAVGTTPVTAPKADGGNVIATDGTYWYHAFLSNGTFTPQVGLSADVLVVAGGGGGGRGNRGGGGGAGGLLGFTSQALASGTSYTCTVGSGGANTNNAGTNGNDSQFGSLTLVKGGGGGGSGQGQYTGLNGGSGGGASYDSLGGSGTSGQGNAGGNGNNAPDYPSGGGGGAGAAGANGSGTQAGAGGVGSSSYSSWGTATNTGQNVSGTYYYAGGGGGGGDSSGTVSGAGGYGGGSGSNTGSATAAATANTGGGGGGGGTGSSQGGAGGSGIIIIRYPVA